MSYVSDSGYGVQSAIGTNSTITPLAGAATFTGTGEQNPFEGALISCYADVIGTLYVDFSVNGTDWRQVNSYSIPAATHQTHIVTKGPLYFRVRFINGAGAQAAFQLYTFFGVFKQQLNPLNQILTQTTDVIAVRSVDPTLDVSAGRVTGFTSVNRFGRAVDGIQTSRTDLWGRADSVATQQIWLAPTAARIHAIVSASANDTAAGTGARTVRVFGLTTWATKESSEVVTMNGTTPVNTVNSYVIINKLVVATCGTVGPNAGVITATAATDTTITAHMRALTGSTEMAIFGWPSTQTLYLKNWKASLNKASAAAAHATYSILYNATPDTQATNYVTMAVTGRQSTGQSAGSEPVDPYIRLDGPGIIKVQATASAANADGSADFGGILVDV